MEFLLVIIVISIQLTFFLITYNRIINLKKLYPNETKASIKTKTLFIVNDSTNEFVLDEDNDYYNLLIETVKEANFKIDNIDFVDLYSKCEKRFKLRDKDKINQELSIVIKILTGQNKNITSQLIVIKENKSWNTDFKQIVIETNDYLKNNRNNAIEFDIIKEISDRVNKKIENSINASVAIPLYLGLLGTMFGIIYGINGVNLNELTSENNGINILLTGVKVAMFGSFSGLLLTMLNSAFFFKSAKFERDRRKNYYYSFLQVYLLPSLTSSVNQSMSKSLSLISRNLSAFNKDFENNTVHFNSAMENVKGIFNLSTEHIDRLAKIDKMLHPVLEIHDKLVSSLDSFHAFNKYQNGLNDILSKTSSSINGVNSVFDKISSVENNLTTIFKEIHDKVTASNELINFIKYQYKGIESISDYTKDLIKDQQLNLKKVYEDYISFLNSANSQIKDNIQVTFLTSVNTQLKHSTENFEKEINNIKDSLKEVYSSDSFSESQKVTKELVKNIDSFKSEIEIVKDTVNKISGIDKLPESIKLLANAIHELKSENNKKNNKVLNISLTVLIIASLITSIVFLSI